MKSLTKNKIVYTNTPLNYQYEYKKNVNYRWKPVILISLVMISMLILKGTANPQGTFEDIAVMTSGINVSNMNKSDSPELNLVNDDVYFPLDGPITSVFASRSDPFDSGEIEEHEGIDIAAVDSTDVLAAMDGIVKAAGRSNGYGNYVLINHSEEMDTLYAHCEEVYVKENDKVYAGDIIAKAGSTGRSTAPHLHFEVRINGEKVDPLPYLER